jgi:hypothetical protein
MKNNSTTVAVIWRALALAGVIALNAGLPAEVQAEEDECYSCFCVGGPCMCLGGAAPGDRFCAVIEEGCFTGGAPCSAWP